MGVHGHQQGQESVVPERGIGSADLTQASSQHMRGMPRQPVSVFLAAQGCPELPPVDNSIFVGKEVEGQILGTYVCVEGYHLVGEKTFVCNASKEWNAPVPTCRCEFDVTASLSVLSPLCIPSHHTPGRPC